MSKKTNKYLILLIYFALALTTLAAFWQVQSNDFIALDDVAYVTDNGIYNTLSADYL